MAADSFEAGRKKGLEKAESARTHLLSEQERKRQANARIKKLSDKVNIALRGKGYYIWISKAYATSYANDILRISGTDSGMIGKGDIYITCDHYGNGLFDLTSISDSVASASNITEEKALELVGVYFGATHKHYSEHRQREQINTITGIGKDILPIILMIGFVVYVVSLMA